MCAKAFQPRHVTTTWREHSLRTCRVAISSISRRCTTSLFCFHIYCLFYHRSWLLAGWFELFAFLRQPRSSSQVPLFAYNPAESLPSSHSSRAATRRCHKSNVWYAQTPPKATSYPYKSQSQRPESVGRCFITTRLESVGRLSARRSRQYRSTRGAAMHRFMSP